MSADHLQLPPGIELKDWLDGPALFLNGKMIACVTALQDGRARSQRCVGTLHLQHEFHTDVAAGQRFICAWATKWHSRIVEIYDGLATGQRATGPAAGHGLVDVEPNPTASRRRRRPRR